MKIFIVGLNKTGTKSISRALAILGFSKRLSHNEKYINLYHENRYEELLSKVDEYEVIEDLPWPMLYKEFDLKYPNAYFILTIRKSAEIWYKSQLKHNKRVKPNIYNSVIYGSEPEDNEKLFIEKYDTHNNEVISHFNNRKNFIVLNFEEGDGWQKLCKFLNKKTPLTKFPHENIDPNKQNFIRLLRHKISKMIEFVELKILKRRF